MPAAIKKVRFYMRSDQKCPNPTRHSDCSLTLKQNVVNRQPTARLCYSCGKIEKAAVQKANDAKRRQLGI